MKFSLYTVVTKILMEVSKTSSFLCLHLLSWSIMIFIYFQCLVMCKMKPLKVQQSCLYILFLYLIYVMTILIDNLLNGSSRNILRESIHIYQDTDEGIKNFQFFMPSSVILVGNDFHLLSVFGQSTLYDQLFGRFGYIESLPQLVGQLVSQLVSW